MPPEPYACFPQKLYGAPPPRIYTLKSPELQPSPQAQMPRNPAKQLLQLNSALKQQPLPQDSSEELSTWKRPRTSESRHSTANPRRNHTRRTIRSWARKKTERTRTPLLRLSRPTSRPSASPPRVQTSPGQWSSGRRDRMKKLSGDAGEPRRLLRPPMGLTWCYIIF